MAHDCFCNNSVMERLNPCESQYNVYNIHNNLQLNRLFKAQSFLEYKQLLNVYYLLQDYFPNTYLAILPDNYTVIELMNLLLTNVRFFYLLAEEDGTSRELGVVCSKITTVSKLSFVDLNKNYAKKSSGSFNVISSSINDNYLFGYLNCDRQYAYLTINDMKHRMKCIPSFNPKFNIAVYKNKFIVVRKYSVFAELFPSGKNIEYIFFDWEDVILVERATQHALSVDKLKENSSKFTIRNKSVMHRNLNNQGKPECWLNVRLDKENNEQDVLLILSNEQLHHSFEIQTTQMYELFYKEKLQLEYGNYEMCKTMPNLKTFQIPPDAQLRFIDNKTNFESDRLLTTSEAYAALLSNKMHTICFTGIVQRRIFVPPLPSRTATHQASSDSFYGTPENQTPVLYFASGCGQEFCLYLNNWEGRPYVLGLLANFKVNVRHVQSQKCKYFKCTPFTGIDVVDYCPDIYFSCVSLLNPCRASTAIGYGILLPEHVNIWGSLNVMYMNDLEVRWPFINCHLNVCDGIRNSQLFISDVKILANFLLSSNTEQIKKCFEAIKQLNINLQFDNYQCDVKSRHQELFISSLLLYFKCMNDIEMFRFDSKCRRVWQNNVHASSDIPLFYCCGVRKPKEVFNCDDWILAVADLN